MAVRLGWRAALGILGTLLVGIPAAVAQHPAGTTNKANDKLLTLAPPERVATLAKAIGHWCIGTEAFPMGVVTSGGPSQGNAYWSLRCADGSAWAIQIDPFAEVTAIDCDSYKANGGGKECFKKF